MRKTKNIFIAVLSLALALFIGACVLAIANHYKKLAENDVRDTLEFGVGEEARIIILAGQSNAEGISFGEYLKNGVTPEQYEKYQSGFENVYINNYSTLKGTASGFVPCKMGYGVTDDYFGPELGLAEKLSELYPGEKFYIVKYAWSGTALHDLWRSPSAGGMVGQLYSGLIKYVKQSINYLEQKNYKVKIEAMCWMQGESDSIALELAEEYASNLNSFISDVRTELRSYASQNGIAFVDAYISDSYFWTYYLTINSAKQAVADLSHINTVIDTISHGLTVKNEPAEEPDLAHYDSLSEIKLGHLFAEECAKFFD